MPRTSTRRGPDLLMFFAYLLAIALGIRSNRRSDHQLWFKFLVDTYLIRLLGNAGIFLLLAKRCLIPRMGCLSNIRGPAQRITILICSRMSEL